MTYQVLSTCKCFTVNYSGVFRCYSTGFICCANAISNTTLLLEMGSVSNVPNMVSVRSEGAAAPTTSDTIC